MFFSFLNEEPCDYLAHKGKCEDATHVLEREQKHHQCSWAAMVEARAGWVRRAGSREDSVKLLQQLEEVSQLKGRKPDNAVQAALCELGLLHIQVSVLPPFLIT